MSRSLSILNRQRRVAVNRRQLRQLALAVLQRLEVDRFNLAICLVDTDEITRLNETFMKHQGPTDVITFDYAERTAARRRKAGPAAVQGEIVICLDEVVLQARRFRAPPRNELSRYVIHGLLHLLGFDDHKPADRRKMKREENRLLRESLRPAGPN